MMTQEQKSTLKSLDRIEDRAHRALMNGSELDARTVHGEEGKNYIAWCAAADKCRAFREAHA